MEATHNLCLSLSLIEILNHWSWTCESLYGDR